MRIEEGIKKDDLPRRIKMFAAQRGYKLSDLNKLFGISYSYLLQLVNRVHIPSDSLTVRINYLIDKFEKNEKES